MSDQASLSFAALQTVPSTSGGFDCKTGSSALIRSLWVYHLANTWQTQTSYSDLIATAFCIAVTTQDDTL